MTRHETFTEPNDIDAPYECDWETRTLNPRKKNEKNVKFFVVLVLGCTWMLVLVCYNLDNIQRWLKSEHY